MVRQVHTALPEFVVSSSDVTRKPQLEFNNSTNRNNDPKSPALAGYKRPPSLPLWNELLTSYAAME